MPRDGIGNLMAIERIRDRQKILLAVAVLGVAWVSGGCSIFEEEEDDDDPFHSSLRYEDPRLEAGFWKMYQLVPEEDRAVLDNEIVRRKDLLIHVFRHKLPEGLSRGGASALHSGAVEAGWCSQDQHPDVKGIRKSRNWDLVYDQQMAERFENGTYNQIDAMFYHEIFGHIVRVLRNPKIIPEIYESKQLYDKFEEEARAIENRYRRYRGYPIVPDELPRAPKR